MLYGILPLPGMCWDAVCIDDFLTRRNAMCYCQEVASSCAMDFSALSATVSNFVTMGLYLLCPFILWALCVRSCQEDEILDVSYW